MLARVGPFSRRNRDVLSESLTRPSRTHPKSKQAIMSTSVSRPHAIPSLAMSVSKSVVAEPIRTITAA